MAHDPVDYGDGHLVVTEHRSRPAELEVRRDHDRLPFIRVGEHLEEQPRPVGIEGQEAELVDHEKSGPPDERGLAIEPPVVAGAAQAHDEGGCREEARLEPPLAGRAVPPGIVQIGVADPSRRSRARRRACRRSAWRCGAASSGPRGRPRERPRPIPRCPRARARPSSGASARRATCPPCRRTSPRCSGSRGAFGRSRTSSARRHPSTVYHSLCPGARSSPPSSPGGLAKGTARGNHTSRSAPPFPGARPSCSNCSLFRARGAQFPVITRTTS